MARLLRISHRLYLSRAEDRGDDDVTTHNTLECLIALAEEEMLRSSIGDEEINIIPRDGSVHRRPSTRRDSDDGHVASLNTLARYPWTVENDGVFRNHLFSRVFVECRNI